MALLVWDAPRSQGPHQPQQLACGAHVDSPGAAEHAWLMDACGRCGLMARAHKNSHSVCTCGLTGRPAVVPIEVAWSGSSFSFYLAHLAAEGPSTFTALQQAIYPNLGDPMHLLTECHAICTTLPGLGTPCDGMHACEPRCSSNVGDQCSLQGTRGDGPRLWKMLSRRLHMGSCHTGREGVENKEGGHGGVDAAGKTPPI